MKKLAIVLSFVFAAAMIAPAFAQETKKAVVTKEAPKEGKACASECAKTCGEKKEAACCSKKEEAKATPAKAK